MAVIHVGPKAAIGKHNTFGISGSTGSIVNDGKFFRFILPIADVFGTEVFRIALSVEGIAVLESFHQSFVSTDYRGEFSHLNNAQQLRHGVLIQVFPHLVSHKKQSGFWVIDDIMYIIRFKFVKNRHNNSSISDGCQESNCPVCTVTTADGNFITRLDTGTFQYNMEFCNLASHVFILESSTFIVSQGV